MSIYTTRVTFEDGKWIAHIDQNGNICIRQERNHYTGEDFNSEADAQAWADKHSAELEALAARAEEERLKKEEDSKRIAEIHAMLTSLVNK